MNAGAPAGWNTGTLFFHWTSAVLIAVQCGLGWAAVAWRLSPLKLQLFVWHKSIGVLLLLFTVLRIGWRLTHGAPVPPAGVPAWSIAIARHAHRMIYVVLFVLPLSGWVISSASNIPFRIFGLLPLPAIVDPSKATASAAGLVHYWLAMALVLLLVAHVGAGLWHHYVRKDETLLRMLPWR